MIRLASFPIQRRGAKRGGFTLIEILVVLAIAAIISSVTLGGFKEMTAGNKRVACSTNLTQLYQAARLYAADEGGKFPYYSNPCTSTPISTDQVGTGLWKLYTFPTKPEIPPLPAAQVYALDANAPIERYLRSAKVLHCPADLREDHDNLLTTAGEIDMDYLSYQTCDDGDDTPGIPGTPTYATQRDDTPTSDAENWKRQLLHFRGTGFTDLVNRQPTGDTIVTYCLHHRGERNMDNVLFYDGSIQLVANQADPADNWKRDPKPLQ